MPNFHTYLIASLPMLNFMQEPPFSFEDFLARCRGLIAEYEEGILEDIGQGAEEKHMAQPSIKKWINFNIMLKNELVKLRAERKKIDPQRYLRPDGYAGPSLYHICLAAVRNPSPQEAEKLLDKARWDYLEDLSFGHYFDFDALLIYAYKLLILQRWSKLNKADKERLLAEFLQEK